MNHTAPIVREVPVGDNVYVYINEYCRNDLHNILRGYHVTYQFKSSNGQWVLQLTGDEQYISKAASGLSEFCLYLASSIGEDSFVLPGGLDREVFTRLAGPRIAKPMQVLVLPQAGTVCQIIGPSDKLAQAKEKLLALADEQVLPRGSDPSQRPDFTTPLGTQVSVIKGNLTLQQTDAIVNPASSDLAHYSGAARAIADAAGPKLTQEGQAFIRAHGPLMVSDVTHTGSGNLYPRIKYVIHAVGPSSGEFPDVNDQRRRLEATFSNCLLYANNKLNVSSISVPAISSGVHGISKLLVAEAALASLQEFERKHPCRSLLTINFVNIDDKSTDAFLEVFRRQMSQNTSTKHAGAQANYRDLSGAGFQNGLAVVTKGSDVNSAKATSATGLQQLPSANASGLSRGCEAAPIHKEKKSKTEDCVICMEPMMKPKELPCGHKFCEDCIKDSFEKCQPKCPSCGRLFGAMRGNQPPGKMTVTNLSGYLPGYEQWDTLLIEYIIPDGIQNNTHPNPGHPYRGANRTAYLPNTPEGKEVCDLLRKAFDAGLIFTVGRSITSGRDNQVIWNDVHHKTNVFGEYGYPDPEYLSRVKEELKAKGIVPTPAGYRCDLM